jgi:hypothetical protein
VLARVIAVVVFESPWLVMALIRLAFVMRATRLPAKVVAIEMGGEDDDVPAPVLEYTHPNGEVKRVGPKWFGPFYKSTKIGDAMSVLVAGDQARINSFTDLWFFNVIMLFSFAVMAAIVLALI